MASFGDALASQTKAKRETRDVDIVLDAEVSERVHAIDARIEELDEERERLVSAIGEERAELARDKRFGDTREAELDEREDAEMTRLGDEITRLLAEREEATRGTLWTFRFVQLPGQDWSEICYRHPPRLDVAIDRSWGYNYHETAKEAAVRSGAILHRNEPEAPADGAEGTAPAAATETLERLAPEQWAQLWVTLSGHEFERILDAVWKLNEYAPAQKVDQAGKAFRAGIGSKSS